MDFTILFWYWLMLGILLIVAKVIVPGRAILCVGLSAVLTGIIVWLAPGLIPGWQLLIWIAVSLVLTLLWAKLLKPGITRDTATDAIKDEIQDVHGIVVRVPQGLDRGIVRFNSPLLGADEWPFICSETVGSGDRVYVKQVTGNILLVEKRLLDDPEPT